MADKTVHIPDSPVRRAIWCSAFGALAFAAYALKEQGSFDFPLGSTPAAHSLLYFVCLAFAVLAGQQLAALAVIFMVRRRQGPAGEIKMLNGFLQVIAIMVVIGAFVYSLGRLQAIGAMAAGFAGMLLGWSLQAPVSGVAAWILVTLKRPFRIGDRVFFSSLGLVGDVKHVGLMYTVMDQVGGNVGSEEAIGRDILIPNAMLFNQVAINYTPKAQAAFILDEVIIRITYDSDWDATEKVMLAAAYEVTADIIRQTGDKPYIRSDMWDYGILMRLRYITMAKDRPRITHEIVRHIFKEVQRNPKVDWAIPFVYSFRKSTDGMMRGHLPASDTQMVEIQASAVVEEGLEFLNTPEYEAESEKLAQNIQERGLLQPIIVTTLPDGRYRVIAGHKRFLACRKLGWKVVPVVVQQEPAADLAGPVTAA
jgi:small-conductance mechanosensitive channel